MIRTIRYSLVSRTALVLAVAMLGSSATVVGQSIKDGSIYSQYGVGELHYSATSQALGMGGGGIALRGARYTNFSNPASYGDQILTSLGAGFTYETISMTDAGDQSGRLSSGNLNFVQFSFPLKTQKFGIGVSFAPYSVSQYRVREEKQLITVSTGDTTSYTIDYGGSGGLKRAALGIGIVGFKNFSVGFEGQAVFGAIDESTETNFEDSGFRGSILSRSSRYLGFSGTIGLLGSVPNLLAENDLVTVGATYTLPLRLNADRVQTAGAPQERDTLNAATEGTFDLPSMFAVGLAYQSSSGGFTAILDGRFEPWSNFSGTIDLPGYSPSTGGNIRNRTRISVGTEWVPAGKDALAGYGARIGYRFGLFYDESYISPSATTTINAIGATVGFSFPTLLPGTRVDLNTEVGKRGTTDNGLVRDVFLKIGLNVNVGERWFLKRKLG